MRTTHQHRIDRALIKTLLDIGDYMLPDTALRNEIEHCVHPRPTDSEITDAIRHADTNKRITGVRAETGIKWKISDAGRAWAAENL